MRKEYFLLAVVLVFLVVGCAKVEPEVLLDSFEGELNEETVDFGSSSDSVLKISADKQVKTHGEQSIKVSYNLTPSGYMWIARGYDLDVKGAARWLVEPEQIKWKAYRAINLSMHGENSLRILALDIKDAKGEIWRYMITDNFEGWKEITAPFDKFFVRTDWQPQTAEKNDVLDFPVMSFQFEPRSPGRGTYYFDNVKVIK